MSTITVETQHLYDIMYEAKTTTYKKVIAVLKEKGIQLTMAESIHMMNQVESGFDQVTKNLLLKANTLQAAILFADLDVDRTPNTSHRDDKSDFR